MFHPLTRLVAGASLLGILLLSSAVTGATSVGKEISNTLRGTIIVSQGDQGGGGGSGGGGGGGSIQPPSQQEIKTINPEEINDILDNLQEGASQVTLDFSEDADYGSIIFNAEQIQKIKEANLSVTVSFGNASISLPVSLFESAGENLSITIVPPDDEIKQALQDYLFEHGILLVSDPIDFVVLADETELLETDDFITRSIHLDEEVDPRTTVGVFLWNGELRSAPTTFSVNLVNILRNRLSTYAVVHYSKTFSDTENHWARETISILASKLIVKGVSESDFLPDRYLTRAEGAALITRSLGLEPENISNFLDVHGEEWYAPEIGAAYQFGAIQGYSDRTFRPNNLIKRAEFITMTIRALENIIGPIHNAEVDILDQDVPAWAEESIRKAVSIHLIKGYPNGLLYPNQNITRAEASTILLRALDYARLIEY